MPKTAQVRVMSNVFLIKSNDSEVTLNVSVQGIAADCK